MTIDVETDLLAGVGLSFRDATVIGFSWKGSDIELDLAGVQTLSGAVRTRINFHEVALCAVDGEVVQNALMEAPDGKLLSIWGSRVGCEFVIEWTDPHRRKSRTRHYLLETAVIEVCN